MGTTNTVLYPGASQPGTPFAYATGVNYSRYADITRVTKKQAQEDLNQISSIAKMIRVFDWNDQVMQVAKDLNLDVALGTNNNTISQFASGDTGAFVSQIKPYADVIRIIAVGNEVFFHGYDVNTVISAIQNLHTAVSSLGIQVTTDVIWASIAASTPPDYLPVNGRLSDNGKAVLPVLKNLYGSKACLLASFYPFLDVKGWVDNPALGKAFAERLLPYVLFDNPSLGPCDNQFDSDYATLRYAMQAGGYLDTTVVVSETGWATDYYSPFSDAPAPNKYLTGYHAWQEKYHLGLTTFWFEMYDESEKGHGAYEAAFGLYQQDSQPKPGIQIPNWTTPR